MDSWLRPLGPRRMWLFVAIAAIAAPRRMWLFVAIAAIAAPRGTWLLPHRPDLRAAGRSVGKTPPDGPAGSESAT
jgi:hypothetical protein